MTVASQAESGRLDRLLGYLEQDPENLALVADAAACAFDAGHLDQCGVLLARYEAARPLPPGLIHLHGLLAMAHGEFDEALQRFESLGEQHGQPGVDYNIAYAHAMRGRYEAAAALDAAVLDAIPDAPALKLRGLHALGRLDDATQLGRAYVDRPDASPAFVGAFATLLFDRGDPDGARRLAERAPDTADGLVITGLFALEAGDEARAAALMQRALQTNPREARATLGLGLCLLSGQQFDAAGGTLDDAASRLATHAGAWVAAGWAYLMGGRIGAARERFERAAALDRGFGEAHGALAVADALDGRADDARRHAQVAQRLDPSGLSAAFAQSLLAEQHGDTNKANEIRSIALNRPLGPDGRTLMQVLTARGQRES
ncbi:tetratricopeptide repeat protein [Burkholderia plantarii]|uniref:tetratricopeptide repeat protein n=1 Tax=Burkholderia plantarii TaxID=41899 RepID=UPI0006D8BE3A|nr:tetratricopeptide repeat protein [Burkholderia plantarii]ALK30144.1 TPR repeat-containing protein [Burkholderia plantarii]GLZ22022.1 hypothetical protein Bpla01_55510 [Burkholderia plantarii]